MHLLHQTLIERDLETSELLSLDLGSGFCAKKLCKNLFFLFLFLLTQQQHEAQKRWCRAARMGGVGGGESGTMLLSSLSVSFSTFFLSLFCDQRNGDEMHFLSQRSGRDRCECLSSPWRVHKTGCQRNVAIIENSFFCNVGHASSFVNKRVPSHKVIQVTPFTTTNQREGTVKLHSYLLFLENRFKKSGIRRVYCTKVGKKLRSDWKLKAGSS